ncbi:5-(carboxyamino)imidazole ribonucleotide mutase [Candidatus Endowatersipora endosymbiont of Watersipora subatra]|uniref:5-(carboxyamino)imidazole ribonucleotide mutase n=1 Tax=Candidatus Endowatersipora endosymbiont of Watersipora subatra TaxID=3077946 RepID=UPI00312C7A6F
MKKDVAVLMGSQSDWDIMRCSVSILDELDVSFSEHIISAHRTPDRMVAFAKSAETSGYKVIIAGAGGSAHLPGMIASMTVLPVLGVPLVSSTLSGIDSLHSIVQMPSGIPVGTLAIGKAGAENAGLFAASILALSDVFLANRLKQWRQDQTDSIAYLPIDG